MIDLSILSDFVTDGLQDLLKPKEPVRPNLVRPWRKVSAPWTFVKAKCIVETTHCTFCLATFQTMASRPLFCYQRKVEFRSVSSTDTVLDIHESFSPRYGVEIPPTFVPEIEYKRISVDFCPHCLARKFIKTSDYLKLLIPMNLPEEGIEVTSKSDGKTLAIVAGDIRFLANEVLSDESLFAYAKIEDDFLSDLGDLE